jgi:UDPglucose 6-dehydrogenase
MPRITVVGAGYVGLTLAVGMVKLGHRVVLLDSEPSRLDFVVMGKVPFMEPGLEEELGHALVSSRLQCRAEPQPDDCPEFVFLAVGTPQSSAGAADTTGVFQAYGTVINATRPPFVLVIKSTVPVGTGDSIESDLARRKIEGVDVVSNPEFLREGSALQDFLRPDRIVIGAATQGAAGKVAALYGKIPAPVMFTSRRSAELSKYAANAMLATRISFINEIASISEALGADIADVAAVIGSDHRIGPAFLAPGLGWGGSCLPKDIAELRHAALSHGCPADLLAAVAQVNSGQAAHAAGMLEAATSGCTDPTVGVLGLAFKAGTDDVRGSPSFRVIERLVGTGIAVRAHDPSCSSATALPWGVEYCADPHEVARNADALVVATEWPAYRELDWLRIRRAMRGTLILDGRNYLGDLSLAALGFDYRAFGRPSRDDLGGRSENHISGDGKLRVAVEHQG